MTTRKITGIDEPTITCYIDDPRKHIECLLLENATLRVDLERVQEREFRAIGEKAEALLRLFDLEAAIRNLLHAPVGKMSDAMWREKVADLLGDKSR